MPILIPDDEFVPEPSDFEALYDPKEIKKHRDAAEKRWGGMTTSDYTYLKNRAKTDLFFLCTGPLEYDKLSVNFHGSYINWLQLHWDVQFRLTLLARGHYKSTTNTIADSIQMTLPNEAGVTAHPYCLGPNNKILIAHEVRETASKFLYQITAAFTRKEMMLFLFPELIPQKKYGRMNKWELELPRTQHSSEATFSTIGAGGAAQGGHYTHLKLDDLVGKEARDSITVMNSTKDWFDNVLPLRTSFAIDGWDLIGTRWAFNDVYSHAMEKYGIHVEGSILNCLNKSDIKKYSGGVLHTYARGAIEDGEIVFPEQMTPEEIKILRKNRLVWAAQFANNPVEAGMTEFVWPLKFYNVDRYGDIVVFTGDSTHPTMHWRLKDLQIYILCDPSMGETEKADETGIMVTGIDPKSNIYVLETVKKRLRPPEFVDHAFRLYFKYHPQVFAIEEVNFSAIYRYWIEKEANRSRVTLPVTPYKPGSRRSKEARIRGLAHFFSAGQVYVHEMMHDFQDEYEQFPMGGSQHLLDALAQGPTFWGSGLDTRSVEAQRKLVEELSEQRSILTGY